MFYSGWSDSHCGLRESRTRSIQSWTSRLSSCHCCVFDYNHDGQNSSRQSMNRNPRFKCSSLAVVATHRAEISPPCLYMMCQVSLATHRLRSESIKSSSGGFPSRHFLQEKPAIASVSSSAEMSRNCRSCPALCPLFVIRKWLHCSKSIAGN